MPFSASGVTITGGFKVTASSRQLAPTGSVIVVYRPATAQFSVGNNIQDANGIVASPDSAGQSRLIHYFVETALFNPYNRSQIVGWRSLGRVLEGSNTLPTAWLGQSVRVNASFRDGLGKIERVFGSPIKLAAPSVAPVLPVSTTASLPGSASNVSTSKPLSVQSSTTTAVTQSAPSRVDQSVFSLQKISDATEGAAAVFRVARTGATNTVATVNVETFSGTAKVSQDFVGKVETVWFDAGETSKDVFISTYLDNEQEIPETFSVQLRSYSSAVVISGQSLITATIQDAAPPRSTTLSAVHSTSAKDILTGTAGADVFQLYATPTFLSTTFSADRITNFSLEQGDRLEISRSAYRLKQANASSREILSASDSASAVQAVAPLIYDRSSGVLSINPLATIDGSGGPIAQFDNKPDLIGLRAATLIV